MSSDKPINAMYGGKVKLDLDKLKNNRKSDEEKSKPVVEVEETITKEPVQEVPNEEVVIESAKEDVIENEVVEEPTDDVKEESSNDECDISDDLKSQLEEKDRDIVGIVDLKTVMNGAGPILIKINELLKDGKKLIVADAVSITDIEQLALAIKKCEKKLLPTGTAAGASPAAACQCQCCRQRAAQKPSRCLFHIVTYAPFPCLHCRRRLWS